MPTLLSVRGAWAIVAGIGSALIGYRMGTRSVEVDNTRAETSRHIDVWNNYIGALRELFIARFESSEEAPTSKDAVATCVERAATNLADSIGSHFGSVAKEALRNLFQEQAKLFDEVFCSLSKRNATPAEPEELAKVTMNLYESGRRMAEYFGSLSRLFRYNGLAEMLKIFIDRTLKMAIDRIQSNLAFETTNIDALMDHTSALANYFANTLLKIDNLHNILKHQ